MKSPSAKKEFQVSSDLSEVQKTSQKVLNFLKPLSLSEGQSFDIRLCLEEALINAIKYGNRLQKKNKVLLRVDAGAGKVRIEVEDQGSGFNVAAIGDCTKGDNLLRNRGRGVFLIHQLMDKVEYNTKGNCVRMVKFLTKEAVR